MKKTMKKTRAGTWEFLTWEFLAILLTIAIVIFIAISLVYLSLTPNTTPNTTTTPTTTTYSCIPYVVATNPEYILNGIYLNETITITNANAIAIENLYIGSNIPYQTSSQKLLLIANETDGTYIIILQNQTLSCLPNG